MRNEPEIRAEIERVENAYAHVLIGEFSTILVNAPRALLQIEAVSMLAGLYFALGMRRPKYGFESEEC